MAEKVVLQTPRRFSADYTLAASLAIEVGPFAEAAVIVTQLANTATAKLTLETGDEPLDGAFSEIPGAVIDPLPAGAATRMLYLTTLGRYMRYRLTGTWTSASAELGIEVWLKRKKGQREADERAPRASREQMEP